MTRTFTGFHGTTENRAKIVMRTSNFIASCGQEEWLGIGVYFFEDDIKQAYNFCVKARKYNFWKILVSKVVCENIVIDLMQSEYYEKFSELAQRVKTRYKSTADGNKIRMLNNSVIMDIMYRVLPYDAVRGAFKVPSTSPACNTNIEYFQIQLCVRNKTCIKSIEEVNYYET